MNKSEDIPTELSELVTKRQIKGKYIFTYNNLPTMVLKRGSIAITASGGGAGYGDVLERDPELVVKDLKEGFITSWVAENIYHVAYDPETLTVDKEKTAELRQKERELRLQKGKSYEEFMQEWLQKKPPEDCLITYGSWPDAKPVRTMTWA
jgi:acetophenone carboxylase